MSKRKREDGTEESVDFYADYGNYDANSHGHAGSTSTASGDQGVPPLQAVGTTSQPSTTASNATETKAPATTPAPQGTVSELELKTMLDQVTKDHLVAMILKFAPRSPELLTEVKSKLPQSAPTLADSAKLFVRDLNYNTTDEGLARAFSEFGDIHEAVVILDKHTGKSRGYGFVTFKSNESASKALAKGNSRMIDGRDAKYHLASMGNPSKRQRTDDWGRGGGYGRGGGDYGGYRSGGYGGGRGSGGRDSGAGSYGAGRGYDAYGAYPGYGAPGYDTRWEDQGGYDAYGAPGAGAYAPSGAPGQPPTAGHAPPAGRGYEQYYDQAPGGYY